MVVEGELQKKRILYSESEDAEHIKLESGETVVWSLNCLMRYDGEN